MDKTKELPALNDTEMMHLLKEINKFEATSVSTPWLNEIANVQYKNGTTMEKLLQLSIDTWKEAARRYEQFMTSDKK